MSTSRRGRSVRALVAAGALTVGTLAAVAPADAVSNGCVATASGTYAVGETVTGSVSPALSGGSVQWIQVFDTDGDGLITGGGPGGDAIVVVSTTATYTIQESDFGKQLLFAASDSTKQCNSHVSPIIGRVGTPVSSQPTLSGKAKVGKTLTAVVGSVPAGTTVSYQWVRLVTKKKKHRVVPKNIGGATGATYKLKKKDKHKKVAVQVTYTKASYNPSVLYTKGKKVH